MSIFSRIFKVAQSEAHSAVDKIEDPIKLTEQGIRDLKKNLEEAMTSLAQVKSVAIRLQKDLEDQKKRAAEYERKAMLLLQKMQNGELEQAEAEKIATQALEEKAQAVERAKSLEADHQAQQNMASQLQAKVEKLRRDINRYENELVTLRARARTADSMKKINKQLAGADSSGTISMLEKMKQRVNEEESLATAYGELSETSAASLDDQINQALSTGTSPAASESLAEMKKRMGIEA